MDVFVKSEGVDVRILVFVLYRLRVEDLKTKRPHF